MKHTPGPWETDEMACYVWGKDENGGPFPVAEIRGWAHLNSHRTDDEAIAIQTANARLIAASPEMKDLLWDAWQDLNALSQGDQTCDACYEATKTMEKIMSLLRRIEGDEKAE